MKSKDIPQMHLSLNTDEEYALEGWDAVNAWAYANYPGWGEMLQAAKGGFVTEEDKLRCLCRFLLGQSVAMFELLHRYAYLYGSIPEADLPPIDAGLVQLNRLKQYVANLSQFPDCFQIQQDIKETLARICPEHVHIYPSVGRPDIFPPPRKRRL